MTDAFDLIVIGGGPGGYQAAQLAGRAGMRVLLIERADLGGTCLNAGCIPTKTLLKSAKLYREMRHADVFGIEAEPPAIKLAAVQARKRDLIAALRQGVHTLLARGRVDIVQGEATCIDRQMIEVSGERYIGRRLLIATGASPIVLDGVPNALTTTQALELEDLPATLGIIGGGPISFGLASIFSMMGVPVTIAEPGATPLPDMDADIRAALLAAMSDVTVLTNTDTVEADVVVVNVGRAPNLDAVTALPLDVTDGIRVDDTMRTNLPDVYAVGDVTGYAMWAHVALREAEVAVNHMLGKPDRMRYAHVPTPVYTVPEAAYVGLTETAARDAGYNVRVHRLPMSANGRFLIDYPGSSGLCKVIVDADTGRLLGVHLLGGSAAETIFGAAALLEDEFRVDEVQQLVFAHPTVSELMKDSLL